MSQEVKKIKTALVSVFHKDGLDEILAMLHADGVRFLSTGGTRTFIEGLGYECDAVEDLTGYPSILGGRVKTLHPKVFGGILNRRDLEGDQQQIAQYEIPEIDLVIVDLYPFVDTVKSGADNSAIIEKIDIGGEKEPAPAEMHGQEIQENTEADQDGLEVFRRQLALVFSMDEEKLEVILID